MTSPEPNKELVFRFFTRPPTTKVGSIFASDRTAPIIEDVDVFPWVPLTAILVCFTAISSPSISARRITGILLLFASMISGLSSFTALE